MKTAAAFSPAHITGLFEAKSHRHPWMRGSRGVGVSLGKGVYTAVYAERNPGWKMRFRINGKPAEAKVSRATVEEFKPFSQPHEVTVDHRVEVPIGTGYGSSGAGALSLALALNEALNAGLSFTEAAQLAHAAEVKCGTGLGTVLGEACGGLGLRVKAGAPGIGLCERVPTSCEKVVSIYWSPLSTESFLKNPVFLEKISEEGKRLLQCFMEKPTVKNFLHYSRKFADRLHFFAEIPMRKILKKLEGKGFPLFAVNMFGGALFTLIEPDKLSELLDYLHGPAFLGGHVFVTDIDKAGARLLG